MVHHYQPTEQQPVFLPFQNKLPQKNEFVSLSKCFDNMMKHDPSTQMVEGISPITYFSLINVS